jgi:protein-disulfide isomerase
MPQLLVPVNETDHPQGSLNSPVTLVEYGDYQCETCKMAVPIMKQLSKELGEKLCFAFRHFPLKTKHPYALEAAKAAEAAAFQNKFWEMHHLLYSKQSQLNPQIWPQLAEQLQLDVEKFKTDLQSSLIEQKIQNDFMAGVRSGVNATPCFYINGERYDQDASYETLKKALMDAN